jgi:hypothetical protein
MAVHRAAAVRPKHLASISSAKKPLPITAPQLDESLETAVLHVGVPDVVPISRFVEVMDHFCSFVETLGNECDIEVVIGIFQESGYAPEVTNEYCDESPRFYFFT